ncbi:unnamed protein product [Vitrella brassicaformis CCMP3155]|uniref:Sushi domain-containing protein n=1 Tax=Vitrella brassicaformis (strain CCMP3155) TaxID=1169540 RepID=A0A0G4FWL9_VITBC|nr:unnamed protein product [Vitrella brassicaformis CCMP3155]|eukprot:CEM19316.1 unnamed protein product [Vitrella brassicaformis CCMP3155]
MRMVCFLLIALLGCPPSSSFLLGHLASFFRHHNHTQHTAAEEPINRTNVLAAVSRHVNWALQRLWFDDSQGAEGLQADSVSAQNSSDEDTSTGEHASEDLSLRPGHQGRRAFGAVPSLLQIGHRARRARGWRKLVQQTHRPDVTERQCSSMMDEGLTYVGQRVFVRRGERRNGVIRWKNYKRVSSLDASLVPNDTARIGCHLPSFTTPHSLKTQAACLSVLSTRDLDGDEGWTIFVLFSTPSPSSLASVLLDRTTGLQVVVQRDKGEGQGGPVHFGLRVGNDSVVVPTSTDLPVMHAIVIRLVPDPTDTPKLRVWVYRERSLLTAEEGDWITDSRAIDSLHRRGPFVVGCDLYGHHCLHGSMRSLMVRFRPLTGDQVIKGMDEMDAILGRSGYCGNGVVDGGEECDTPEDDGTCSIGCKKLCEPWFEYEAVHQLNRHYIELEGPKTTPTRMPGETRTLRCHLGYSPGHRHTHTQTIVCEHGRWTPPSLNCRRDFALSYQLIAPRDLHVSNHTHDKRHGTVVEVSCREGLQLGEGVPSGPRHVKCIDGEWTSPGLQCFASCGGYPDLGPHYRIEGGSGSVRHGAVRTVTCREPYRSTSGADSAVVYCSHGRWTELDLSCEAPCPRYEAPSPPCVVVNTSRANHTSRPPNMHLGDVRHQGGWIEIGCDRRISAASCHKFGQDCAADPQRIWCLGGRWQKLTLSCHYNCPGLEDFKITNTRARPDLSWPRYTLKYGGNRHGDVTDLTCSDGYVPVNRDMTAQQVRCWEGTYDVIRLDCRAECLSSVPLPLRGYVQIGSDIRHGSRRVVQCDEGEGYGSIIPNMTQETLYCSDGYWSPHSLQCRVWCESQYLQEICQPEQDECTGPYRFEPPLTIADTYPSQFSVDVRCNDAEGYVPTSFEPTGNTSQIDTTETLRCLGDPANPSHSWSDLTLQCAAPCVTDHLLRLGQSIVQRWIYASEETRVINGRLTGDQEIPSSVYHNARVELTCAEGFNSRFLNGSGYPTRQRSLVECRNGQWTDVELECAASCKEYEYPGAGYEVQELPYIGALFHGARRVLRCDPLVASAAGNTTEDSLVCVNGVWTRKTITCKRS